MAVLVAQLVPLLFFIGTVSCFPWLPYRFDDTDNSYHNNPAVTPFGLKYMESLFKPKEVRISMSDLPESFSSSKRISILPIESIDQFVFLTPRLSRRSLRIRR